MKARFAAVALAAALAFGCADWLGEDSSPEESHEASGMRFPAELGEFLRHDRELGLAPTGVRVTYARKGAFCKIAIEPVAAEGTADEILGGEFRASEIAHDQTLYSELTRGGPEDPLESEHSFRGQTLRGAGIVTSRDSRSGSWQAALETFVVDGWNVSFVTLERSPDRSRPPTALVSCADAFFAANEP